MHNKPKRGAGDNQLNIPNLWKLGIQEIPMNISADKRLDNIIINICIYAFENMDKYTKLTYGRNLFQEMNNMFEHYSTFANILVDNILIQQNFIGYLLLQNNYELEYNAIKIDSERNVNYVNNTYLYMYIISQVLNKDHGLYLVQFLDKIKDETDILALISNFIIGPFLKNALYEKEKEKGIFKGGKKHTAGFPFRNPFRNTKTYPQQIAIKQSQGPLKPHNYPSTNARVDKDVKTPYAKLLNIVLRLFHQVYKIQNADLNGLFSKYKMLFRFDNIYYIYCLHEAYICKYIWYYIIQPNFMKRFPINEWFMFTKQDSNGEFTNIKFLNDNPNLLLNAFNVKGPFQNDYIYNLFNLLASAFDAYVKDSKTMSNFKSDLQNLQKAYANLKSIVDADKLHKRNQVEEKMKALNAYLGSTYTYVDTKRPFTASSSRPRPLEVSSNYYTKK